MSDEYAAERVVAALAGNVTAAAGNQDASAGDAVVITVLYAFIIAPFASVFRRLLTGLLKSTSDGVVNTLCYTLSAQAQRRALR